MGGISIHSSFFELSLICNSILTLLRGSGLRNANANPRCHWFEKEKGEETFGDEKGDVIGGDVIGGDAGGGDAGDVLGGADREKGGAGKMASLKKTASQNMVLNKKALKQMAKKR